MNTHVEEPGGSALVVATVGLDPDFEPFLTLDGLPAHWQRISRFRAGTWTSHPRYDVLTHEQVLDWWTARAKPPVRRHDPAQLQAALLPLRELPMLVRWIYWRAAARARREASRLTEAATDVERVQVIHELVERWNRVSDVIYNSIWRAHLLETIDLLAAGMGLPGGHSTADPLPKSVSGWADWNRDF